MNIFKGKRFPCYLVLALVLLVTLSCACGDSGEKKTTTPDNPADNKGTGQAVSTGKSEWPEAMNKAIAKAMKENKVAVIELFDKECNFCIDMRNTLKNKVVLSKLKEVAYATIMLEDSMAVVDEYGLMESPTFLFYDPKGQYMEPFIQGFRPPKLFVMEIDNYILRSQGKPEKEIPDDHNDYNHPSFGKG